MIEITRLISRLLSAALLVWRVSTWRGAPSSSQFPICLIQPQRLVLYPGHSLAHLQASWPHRKAAAGYLRSGPAAPPPWLSADPVVRLQLRGLSLACRGGSCASNYRWRSWAASTMAVGRRRPLARHDHCRPPPVANGNGERRRRWRFESWFPL